MFWQTAKRGVRGHGRQSARIRRACIRAAFFFYMNHGITHMRQARANKPNLGETSVGATSFRSSLILAYVCPRALRLVGGSWS
jgi:hypothetical protein